MPKKKTARQDLDTQLASELRQMQQIQANITKIQTAKKQQLDQRRTALRAQIDDHAQAIKTLEAELKSLDTVDVTKTTTAAAVAVPKKKPGPKPGSKRATPAAKAAKVAAKVAKAAAKKAAPKKVAAKKVAAKKVAAKKAAAPKKPSKSVSSAVAEGRRAVARGDRPPMKEAIARVMGRSTMDAASVIQGLTEKNWMPNTAPEKTQQYISYILSSTDEVFERVERGKYKVKEGVTFVHKTKAPKVKAVVKKETPTTTSPKIESALDIDALPNPFTT